VLGGFHAILVFDHESEENNGEKREQSEHDGEDVPNPVVVDFV